MLPLLQWKSNVHYTIRVCVFVALGNQHAMRTRELPRSTIFFPRYLLKGRIFLKKKLLDTKCFF